MDVLFLLVPLSVLLVFALMAVFAWALQTSQFDDLDREGGRILDPENGKEYRLTLQPTDGGARLRVRGYLGPFFRTQTWVRVAPP